MSDESSARAANFARKLDATNTIDGLEQLRLELVGEKQRIEVQLTDKSKKGEPGYDAWRTKAVYAKMCVERQLMATKLKLKNAQRSFNHDAPLRFETLDDLLHAAYVTINELASAFELSSMEQSKVDRVKQAIDAHLRSKAVVKVNVHAQVTP